MFTTQYFGSTSNNCEKLRPTVICSTARLQPGGSGIQGNCLCTWPANSPFLFVCIISCTALLRNVLRRVLTIVRAGVAKYP